MTAFLIFLAFLMPMGAFALDKTLGYLAKRDARPSRIPQNNDAEAVHG